MLPAWRQVAAYVGGVAGGERRRRAGGRRAKRPPGRYPAVRVVSRRPARGSNARSLAAGRGEWAGDGGRLFGSAVRLAVNGLVEGLGKTAPGKLTTTAGDGIREGGPPQGRVVLGRRPRRQGLAAVGDHPGRTAALGNPSAPRHRGRPSADIVRPLRWRAAAVPGPHRRAAVCAVVRTPKPASGMTAPCGPPAGGRRRPRRPVSDFGSSVRRRPETVEPQGSPKCWQIVHPARGLPGHHTTRSTSSSRLVPHLVVRSTCGPPACTTGETRQKPNASNSEYTGCGWRRLACRAL